MAVDSMAQTANLIRLAACCPAGSQRPAGSAACARLRACAGFTPQCCMHFERLGAALLVQAVSSVPGKRKEFDWVAGFSWIVQTFRVELDIMLPRHSITPPLHARDVASQRGDLRYCRHCQVDMLLPSDSLLHAALLVQLPQAAEQQGKGRLPPRLRRRHPHSYQQKLQVLRMKQSQPRVAQHHWQEH